MVSSRNLKLLGAFINGGYILRFLPYRFERQTQRFVFDPRRGTRARFWANILCFLLYEGFLGYRLKQTLSSSAGGELKKLRALYYSFVDLVITFTYYIAVKNYGTLHIFFNELLRSTTKMKVLSGGLQAGNDSPSKDQCAEYERDNRKTLIFAIVFCFIVPVLRPLNAIFSPTNPDMLTSIFPSPSQLPLWVKLTIAAFQCNAIGLNIFMLTVHGSVLITSIYSILPVIVDLRLKQSRVTLSYRKGAARTIQKISSQLGILQASCNHIFKAWPLGFEICFGTVVIVRLFLAVILGNVKDFVAALVALSTVILFFRGFAEVYDVSAETQDTWRVIHNPTWFRKYRRACQPLSISVGGFFMADKELILTLISIIINNSTSLILAYR